MQEWIIAMLVVSALLILRDMAKTIFSDMKKSAATLVYDQHPQKEKMQRYARSFQKLADSFYGMPYRKDYLSGGELEELVEQLRERQCKTCPANHICWKQHSVQCYGGRGRGETQGGEDGAHRGLHQPGQAYAGNAEVNGERTTESDVE